MSRAHTSTLHHSRLLLGRESCLRRRLPQIQRVTLSGGPTPHWIRASTWTETGGIRLGQQSTHCGWGDLIQSYRKVEKCSCARALTVAPTTKITRKKDDYRNERQRRRAFYKKAAAFKPTGSQEIWGSISPKAISETHNKAKGGCSMPWTAKDGFSVPWS